MATMRQLQHTVIGGRKSGENLLFIRLCYKLHVADITVRRWQGHSMDQLNTLRPRQNGRHFADAIFKDIFLTENLWIPIKIALKFVPKGPTNNIPALVQIMVWRRPGDKPLSEPMMVTLLMHICVTRPQWVNLTCYVLHFNSLSHVVWLILYA